MFEFWRQNCVPATPNLDFEGQTYALVVKMVKNNPHFKITLSLSSLTKVSTIHDHYTLAE